MKIKINHISKTEGSSGFEGALLEGDIAQARIEVQEGARLIEGLLLGRHFSEVPVITARICGICPVVHNLTAIKALEAAFGVKVTQDIIKLRKIMLLAQIIHSHALHLFFLSLPDFKAGRSDFDLVRKYPSQAQKALVLRQFATEIIKVIGGRAIHPVSSEVGGFRKKVNLEELGRVMTGAEGIFTTAVDLAVFFRKLKYPKFSRPTNFVSLNTRGEYAIYEGEIKINDERYQPDKFLKTIEESEVGVVKRTTHGGRIYMLGALARINNNYVKLNPEAKKIWQAAKLKMPSENTLYNVLAQAVEIVHAVLEIKKVWDSGVGLRTKVNYQIRAGKGLGVCEAPRGTLFHYYEIDSDGIIQKSNIITPTAQFLNNLEEDLKILLPQTKHWSPAKREARVKMLIRAYDPCFTCAAH